MTSNNAARPKSPLNLTLLNDPHGHLQRRAAEMMANNQLLPLIDAMAASAWRFTPFDANPWPNGAAAYRSLFRLQATIAYIGLMHAGYDAVLEGQTARAPAPPPEDDVEALDNLIEDKKVRPILEALASSCWTHMPPEKGPWQASTEEQHYLFLRFAAAHHEGARLAGYTLGRRH